MAKIDWFSAQRDYVSDQTLSFEDIAAKYGVSKTAVSNKAKQQGWSSLRQELYEKAKKRLLEEQSDEVSKADKRHLEAYQALQRDARSLLKKQVLPPQSLLTLAKAIKIGIEGERTCLGLDNPGRFSTEKLELGIADVLAEAHRKKLQTSKKRF